MQRKNNQKKETIDGSKLKIGIVVSKFNSDITGGMLQGTMDVLEKNKVKKSNIKTVWVPGAFEIPLACQKAAKTKKFDALIALGCVIKGGTDHYYFVSNEAARGIMDVMLKYDIPIGFGVITTNNLKQAQDRSRGKNNKGAEATQAVLEMISEKI